MFRRISTNVLVVGLGSGFSGLGSPLLITELAHPCERGKITALYKYASNVPGYKFT
jgi:hypothetical protein